MPKKVELKKSISHPFVILIVGAIISSLVIPYFTRQWQDNQKQLELKTALADDINKAVSDSIVSSRLATAGQIDPKDYNNSFKNWEISKEIFGSKIEAYFSDNRIRQNWDNLSSAVGELSNYIVGSDFPQLNDTHYYVYDYNVCNRLAHVLKLYTSYPQNNPINIDRNVLTKYHCNQFYIQVLNLQDFTRWTKDQKYFPIRDNKSVDWNALFYANQTNYNEFRRSFALVQNDIEDHKNNLLGVIFRSPITAFK